MSPANHIEWRWVLQLGATLVALVLLPVAIGIVLDQVLKTSPAVTLCMMFLGLNMGMYSIAHSVAERYKRVGGDQC